jgi:3',5'-cyclic AMP phosphodiesterase CpdA
MSQDVRRRDLLALAGLGGVVFASGLVGCGGAEASGAPPQVASGTAPGPAQALAAAKVEDFFFLQLTDTHWGFKGPPNPEADICLKKTVAAINASAVQPDFIVFTGDLTHTTDDAKERRARMAEFKEIVAGLTVKKQYYLPGEHDALPDQGAAYKEAFGPLYQSFQHKGVSFIALDNASAPGGLLGDAQLDWLKGEIAKVPAGAPLVVLAHRPLFDLFPEWEWTTKDGARAIELLSGRDATVFYGHIHQENHKVTGRLSHHSARSLIFPLPAPGSVPKRAPLPWDPASKDHGIGHRAVTIENARARVEEKPFA